jgi:hypothetical protein
MQILDIQARGFTRASVFVIACSSPEVIDWVCLHKRSELHDLTDKLQQYSRSHFLEDLRQYQLSLQDAIHNCQNSGILASKIDDLSNFLRQGNFSLPEGDSQDFERHPPEYFTQINNDLRPMEKMTQITAYEQDITEFLDSLPATAFQINCLVKSPCLNFDSASQMAAVFTENYTRAKFLILQSKCLPDCLFTLLSGRTLFLVSEDCAAARSLATRFAVMSPFGSPFSVGEADYDMTLRFVQYSIVVSRFPNPRFGCVYNLDQGTFRGTPCPPDSILATKMGRFSDGSENIAVICAANDVRRIYARFKVKLADVLPRPLHTEEDMLDSLKSVGFAPSDVPLLRYWMVCLASGGGPKPILLDQFLTDIKPLTS